MSPVVQYVNPFNTAPSGDLIQVVNWTTNLSALTGTSANGNVAFTGPATPALGDLAVWVGIGRGATGSPPAALTGGAVWTQLQNTSANPRQLHISTAPMTGNWTGSLAGANSVTGANFAFLLRSTSGTTWNIETVTGPSGVGATTTHSVAAGTPSGGPALLFGVVQNAAANSYASFAGGAYVSALSGDYWNNTNGSGISGYIWKQYQPSAVASGSLSATCSASAAYTRTLIAVYRS